VDALREIGSADRRLRHWLARVAGMGGRAADAKENGGDHQDRERLAARHQRRPGGSQFSSRRQETEAATESTSASSATILWASRIGAYWVST
jgi:hypothetical protein